MVVPCPADAQAYYAWSVLDDFEWTAGYKPRTGLFYVNYRNMARYLKLSGRWYSQHFLRQSR
jgi:beta-glucosidase